MKNYGLIGKTLGHSFSKKHFEDNYSFNSQGMPTYQLFELPNLIGVRDWATKNHISGFNVTIPFKSEIIPFLDELDPLAEKIGAVNCVKLVENQNQLYLKGYNTDYLAFEQSLSTFLNILPNRVLILGTGGSSKMVQTFFLGKKILFDVVSRDLDKGKIYSSLNQTIEKYQLIVNTTPLGMFPNVHQKPDIPYHELTEFHHLYDLIYNPVETQFLKMGKNQKCHIKNGQEMLSLQADFSWQIWKL